METRIAQEADGIAQEAIDVICKNVNTDDAENPVVLFNTLSWMRHDPVQLPDGSWRNDIAIPAGGWKIIDAAIESQADCFPCVKENGRILENRFWRIKFNECGRIVSLFDKRNDREILSKGGLGNDWQVFEDRPTHDDAWNIDFEYQEHSLEGPKLFSIKAIEESVARAAVELVWQMPQIGVGQRSTITQLIAIYCDSERIDFETKVDWHEHHQLLKVAFPVCIRATEASHQIQFGHIRRPTHHNTSWDKAKFETCAQQFVDLSEEAYGVALLNDCKYGHDIFGNTIRLTCIKCAQLPDPLADQGLHEFTYSLLPHAGSLQAAGVVRAAAELNNPVLARVINKSSGKRNSQFQFFDCDNDAVVVDTIKPAEDGDGIIVRLYESQGSHGRAKIKFALPVKSVEYVNLLEQSAVDAVELKFDGNSMMLNLRPFQLVTMKIVPA